jgi:hypothetical protein
MRRGVAAGYRGYSSSSPGEHGDTDVPFYMPSKGEEPFACPVGEALWRAYRERTPDGLTVPPIDGRNVTDPEILPYIKYVGGCDDCKEV